MKTIRIVLAEDHVIVREGLRGLLELAPDLEVVGEASNGREAVALALELAPSVVVMDIAMSELNGFEATRQIVAAAPEVRVLALSAHSDDEYIAHMAAVGASGYVLKQTSGEALVFAIREIASGRAYFSPAIRKRRSNSERRDREAGRPRGAPARTLTAREAEVLQLVAEGSANKQVAAKLGISVKTVEKHRQQLMDKLDIHDTAGLTRYAMATGVIQSGAQESAE